MICFSFRIHLKYTHTAVQSFRFGLKIFNFERDLNYLHTLSQPRMQVAGAKSETPSLLHIVLLTIRLLWRTRRPLLSRFVLAMSHGIRVLVFHRDSIIITGTFALYSSPSSYFYQPCQVDWQDGHSGFREHKAGLVKAQDGRACTATDRHNDGASV